eukprot:gnl/Spiro4/11227_TR5919_c0_g1_i1.p1 gnl/Spiro4/11227_TR5919_c0_g1~~gnl/Spiro4/11227_TR5919_c0_g1_i1.p1  ORF type:complete len:344 (+),score=41.24 gnl/Spiro4/11227_TR5919_c0_g1_i1:49-1080(+)
MSVEFSALAAKDGASLQSLRSQIQTQGYAFVRCPNLSFRSVPLSTCVSEVHAATDRFCTSDRDISTRESLCSTNSSCFYHHWKPGEEQQNEFLEVRDVCEFPSADFADGLPFYSHCLFEMLKAVALVCYSGLAEAAQARPEAFLSLLDPPAPGVTPFSSDHRLPSSSMRVYRRMADMPCEFACREHTDRGLLTVAPASSSNCGLEMKRLDSAEYFDVERCLARDTDTVAVFIGETLSRLTCGFYPAILHRVSTVYTSARVSMPFFLRSPDDALVESALLRSPLIQIPDSIREKPAPTVTQMYLECDRPGLWPWKRKSYYPGSAIWAQADVPHNTRAVRRLSIS